MVLPSVWVAPTGFGAAHMIGTRPSLVGKVLERRGERPVVIVPQGLIRSDVAGTLCFGKGSARAVFRKGSAELMRLITCVPHRICLCGFDNLCSDGNPGWWPELLGNSR